MGAVTPPFIPSFGNGVPGVGGRGQPPIYFDTGNGYAEWVFHNGVWHQSSSGVLVPVTIVQFGFETNWNQSVTLPAPPTPGNLLVALGSYNGGHVVTEDPLWPAALVNATGLTSLGEFINFRTALVTDGATIDVLSNVFPAGGGFCALYELAGGAGIIDVFASQINVGGSDTIVEAITPTGTNGLGLFHASTSSVSAFSAMTNATLDASGLWVASRGGACGHFAAATVMTYNPTCQFVVNPSDMMSAAVIVR